MTQKIFKYALEITDEQVVTAPRDWKPLFVDHQRSILYLWAEVDDEAELVDHPVSIRGTGHEIYRVAGNYLGSSQHNGLVWHVYAGRAL